MAKVDTKDLIAALQVGKQEGKTEAYNQGNELVNAAMGVDWMKIAGGGGNRPGEDGPYRPPNPDEVPGVPPGYPNIPKKFNLAHRSHEPSAIIHGIPRYGWGDDSHDPSQHNALPDPAGNPIPVLAPTDLEIDQDNMPYGDIDPQNYTPDGQLISKTPQQQLMTDVINKVKKLTNEGKHKEAHDLYKLWFPQASAGGNNQVADAKALTDTLSPFQNKKGSLKDSGLSNDEIIKLLKIGVQAHKA
tara:strand:- start:132 stop:863 length:732 start_codon:yes stop_codon:yes gene_type:complete